MTEEVLKTLHEILEQDPATIPDEDEKIFGKMQAGYDACMDVETLQDLGLQPLQNLVDSVRSSMCPQYSPNLELEVGQRPLLGSPRSLTETFLLLLESGIQSLVSLYIVVSPFTINSILHC